jgi:chromosome segregation ATPase
MSANDPAHADPSRRRNVYDATMQAMHAGSTDARLDAIDAKVDSLGAQMGELRQEMREDRQETREEMRGLRNETREEMRGLRNETRGEMRGLRNETRGEMRELRYEMKAGFERVDDHFERMHRLMVQGVIGLSAAYLAGFAALIGLIATQL